MVSFIRDATEQRAAQEALRLNDLRLRSIVESIGEYAIYLLDRDGHVLTWNPGAERIKGYKADEVLGLHFSRFFTQEDEERGRPAELLRQAAARDRVEEEGWRVRKDGSRFWANVVHHCHPRQQRRGNGVRQGHARHDRPQAGAEESLICQLSGALLANMDVRKLLGAISASIREMIPHDDATLALYDERSRRHGACSFSPGNWLGRLFGRIARSHRWLAVGSRVPHARAGAPRTAIAKATYAPGDSQLPQSDGHAVRNLGSAYSPREGL